MRKNKSKYLSALEIQQILKEERYLPTAIFSAKKKDYIVKPSGTIFGSSKNKAKGIIKW